MITTHLTTKQIKTTKIRERKSGKVGVHGSTTIKPTHVLKITICFKRI